jgi:hypothetical protein
MQDAMMDDVGIFRDGSLDLRYKPVTITKFQPKERVY